MASLWDMIPYDIQEYIYGIRLSNAITKNHNMRTSYKLSCAQLLLNISPDYNNEICTVYDPCDKRVCYIANKCANILSNTKDDRIWWITQLIRPIERGLIIYKPHYNDKNAFSPTHDNTEYACDKLIDIFKCKRNPRRNNSIS